MPIRSLCITEGGDRPTMETFIGMRRAGIDITAICPADHPNHGLLVEAGVPTLDLRLNRNFDRDDIAQLRQELVRGRYHIMHTFNSRALTNGLRACKGLPVKVVAYRGIVGNLSFLDPMSWMRYRIVCVCEAIRQWFLHMQPAFLRMPPERPVTIHKGHKLEWYADRPVDLAQFGIPDGAFVIGCTAAYRPRKGIEYLIDALGMLPDDIPAHLLLIGRMESGKLTRRINSSPAADRIHRSGHRRNARASHVRLSRRWPIACRRSSPTAAAARSSSSTASAATSCRSGAHGPWQLLSRNSTGIRNSGAAWAKRRANASAPSFATI